MGFFGALIRFAAWFVAFLAMGIGLLLFASHRLGHFPPEEPAAGRPYTAETWERLHGPAGPEPAGARPEAGRGPSEPATVTEARRWARCHGPACYHDVRPEARPFLPLAD